MSEKEKNTIYIKLVTPKGKIRKYSSDKSTKRILSHVSHDKFLKAYVKVSYGKKKCLNGCICEFFNDGWYTDPKQTEYAIKTFWREK